MAGIYAHIPYCHSKCAYCDFYSTPRGADRAGAYVTALIRELHNRRHELGSQPVTTGYIGGGTPSIIPIAELGRLVDAIATPDMVELTVEANPEDVTRQWINELRRTPVNRVSIGVQSLIDAELTAVGRRHTAADAERAVKSLQDAGITNVSVDLIYGLPGQTHESLLTTLRGLLSWQPTHLSAYALMIEQGTRLWAQRQAGRLQVPADDEVARMYHSICSRLASAGMEHYEISNYALPGYKSRHNGSYWDLTPYLGLGVSAHSFDGSLRRYNPADIARYIASDTPVCEAEPEDERERFNDYVMIRLRTADGLDPAMVERHFGPGRAQQVTAIARRLVDRGQLQPAGSAFRIPEERWIVADPIITEFIDV